MKGEKETTKTQNQVENWLNENSLSAKNMMLICAYIQRKGLKVPHNTHFKNKSKGTFESFKTWFETQIFRIGDVVGIGVNFFGFIEDIKQDTQEVVVRGIAKITYSNGYNDLHFGISKNGFWYRNKDGKVEHNENNLTDKYYYKMDEVSDVSLREHDKYVEFILTQGFYWDKEDKTFRIKTDNQWKPKTLDYYYLVDDCLNVVMWKTSNLDIIDRRIKSNNYFRTEQAAQEAANKFQEILKTLPKE